MQLYASHDEHVDGLVQDCSNSNALAMKLLQSCTKPSIYFCFYENIAADEVRGKARERATKRYSFSE